MGFEKHQHIRYIRAWGGSNSDALLDPVCHLFTPAGVEGVVGYRPSDHTLVALGDPVCAPDSKKILANAFQNFCREQQKNFIYAVASEEFAKQSLNNGCGAIIEFGQELFLDPKGDHLHGNEGRLLRKKIRHASNSGVEIHEYTGYNEELEKRFNEVAESWLNNKQGPQIYISHIRLFEDRYGKRWFYAQRGYDIVGVMVLSELKSHQGWIVNRLMALPHENGVSELLVMSVLAQLGEEGCKELAIGAMPAGKLGNIEGLNAFTQWMSRKIYAVAQRIFHLDSKRKYWDKFNPKTRASYLIFDKAQLGIRKLCSLARALNVSI